MPVTSAARAAKPSAYTLRRGYLSFPPSDAEALRGWDEQMGNPVIAICALMRDRLKYAGDYSGLAATPGHHWGRLDRHFMQLATRYENEIGAELDTKQGLLPELVASATVLAIANGHSEERSTNVLDRAVGVVVDTEKATRFSSGVRLKKLGARTDKAIAMLLSLLCESAIRWSAPMTLGQLAKVFKLPNRGVVARLKATGVRVKKVSRQAYRVPLKDLPPEK